MNWILLVVAGLCEVGFTYCLGRARSVEGLLWWLWMGGFLLFTIVSMGLLAKVTQTMPLGTAYPVWTGIGAVGTVVVGILFLTHRPQAPSQPPPKGGGDQSGSAFATPPPLGGGWEGAS